MVVLHDRVPVPAFHGMAGVATRDVTPPVGIRARNWGPADWDAATGTHRPLVLTSRSPRSRSPRGVPVTLA